MVNSYWCKNMLQTILAQNWTRLSFYQKTKAQIQASMGLKFKLLIQKSVSLKAVSHSHFVPVALFPPMKFRFFVLHAW